MLPVNPNTLNGPIQQSQDFHTVSEQAVQEDDKKIKYLMPLLS